MGEKWEGNERVERLGREGLQRVVLYPTPRQSPKAEPVTAHLVLEWQIRVDFKTPASNAGKNAQSLPLEKLNYFCQHKGSYLQHKAD